MFLLSLWPKCQNVLENFHFNVKIYKQYVDWISTKYEQRGQYVLHRGRGCPLPSLQVIWVKSVVRSVKAFMKKILKKLFEKKNGKPISSLFIIVNSSKDEHMSKW